MLLPRSGQRTAFCCEAVLRRYHGRKPVELHYEADGSDVRLDRMRVYSPRGEFEGSFLLDKMGVLFKDNLPGTEDDFVYLRGLPSRERGK